MDFRRQISFSKIGIEKQKLIARAKVCVVGCGALGTSSAELLIRSGIINLILIDKDIVEEHNLQRQSLFYERDIGRLKAEVLKERLLQINSQAKISSFNIDLEINNVNKIKTDIVLDCTDNFKTRFLINDFCKKEKIPWIYASVAESKGMCFTILPNGPCLRCIFNESEEKLDTCETIGVINTIVKIISAIQVNEIIKFLIGDEVCKELIKFDVWKNELEKFKVINKKGCLSCSGEYPSLKKSSAKSIVRKCSSKGAFEVITNKKIDLKKLEKQFEVIVCASDLIIIKKDNCEITVYKNGKMLIKNCENIKEAEKIVELIEAIK